MKAVSKAIATIGTRHRLEIICALLAKGPSNFNELKRVLGMNSTTLSRTLKFLEGRGIIKRNVINERPVSVSYSLTTIGQSFSDVMECMDRWGKKLAKTSA
ncbi:MAG: helix-turn-helix transcriptional regulator [Candidatus Aenigmarchaeota archaeon]|nr:helix-turn-helix transcriptional regulator [Candidatus Aenigmarchaeota archaeon]